jgi:hypothetical protein
MLREIQFLWKLTQPENQGTSKDATVNTAPYLSDSAEKFKVLTVSLGGF